MTHLNEYILTINFIANKNNVDSNRVSDDFYN